MKVLNRDIDLELFYHRRNEASQKVLLLDYDGTLAPFHKEPNKAEPYPGIRHLLNKIMHVPDIRLVIISGRWTKDLIPLLQLEKQPEIWGSHGLERLKTDGSYEIDSIDEKHLDGLVAADEGIEELGLTSRCEKKPGSLAIHWRGLDQEMVNEIRPDGRLSPRRGSSVCRNLTVVLNYVCRAGTRAMQLEPSLRKCIRMRYALIWEMI
jgi:trehalose-6-phosphatase